MPAEDTAYFKMGKGGDMAQLLKEVETNKKAALAPKKELAKPSEPTSAPGTPLIPETPTIPTPTIAAGNTALKSEAGGDEEKLQEGKAGTPAEVKVEKEETKEADDKKLAGETSEFTCAGLEHV